MLLPEPTTLEASRFKCLAEAVIIQAIKDATHRNGGRKVGYKNSGHVYSIDHSAEAASQFLLSDVEMFPFWCEAAGLIPGEVRRRLMGRLKKRTTFDLIRALHRTRQRKPNV